MQLCNIQASLAILKHFETLVSTSLNHLIIENKDHLGKRFKMLESFEIISIIFRHPEPTWHNLVLADNKIFYPLKEIFKHLIRHDVNSKHGMNVGSNIGNI